MEGFFSGLVILLYLISHYASEFLFISACVCPIALLLVCVFVLHFGGQGRIVRAYRRAKKRLGNGVIAGSERERFREGCLKGAPLALRAGFSAFAEGEISSYSFCEKARESVKGRRAFCLGAYFGLTIALSVLAFSSFYFVCPLNEAILRFSISIFFLTLNGAILCLASFGYARASDNAAVRLSELLDKKLLRVKRSPDDLYPALRYTGGAADPSTDSPFGTTPADKASAPHCEKPKVEETPSSEEEAFDRENSEKGIEKLRRFLRETDALNI